MDRCTVAPLVPARRAGLLALFDAALAAPAAEARACGTCCCNLYALPEAIDFAALDAQAQRVAAAARIDVGEADGYVALDGDAVVGWLDVQPRHRVPHAFARLRVPPPGVDVPPHDAAVALCLVVAPRAPVGAVASALIAGAVDSLRRRGFRVVDVFPRPDAAGPAPHEPGPVAWWTAAGFEPLGNAGARAWLRRRLAETAPALDSFAVPGGD